MGFIKYVCPEFEENIDYTTLVNRIQKRNLKGFPQHLRGYLESILSFLESLPYDLALVDGVLKGTPAEMSNFNAVIYDSEFSLVRHSSQMVLPFSGKVTPAVPLVQIVLHERRFSGDDPNVTTDTDGIQHFLNVYYEQPPIVGYGLQGDRKIIPTDVYIGRDPTKYMNIPLSNLYGVLRQLERLLISEPSGDLPWLVHREAFFSTGKREINDVDGIEEFLKLDKLVFI